jgi:SAM-dependent methyltransferase
MAEQSEIEWWNARYASEDYLFGTAPNRFLAAQASLLPPGGRALCIADGEGRNGVWLAQQGLTVTSVEFAAAAIAKAHRLAAQRGVAVDIVQADLATWDWGAPRFDVVAGIFFQFLVPALRASIFRRMQEVLLPGGLLLIEGYTPAQLAHGTGGPSQVENLYTEALLRESFAAMEILHLAEYEAELAEGTDHVGVSAVIDLVARKPAA